MTPPAAPDTSRQGPPAFPRLVVFQVAVSVVAVGVLIAVVLQIGPLIERKSELEAETQKLRSGLEDTLRRADDAQKRLTALEAEQRRVQIRKDELEGELRKAEDELARKMRELATANVELTALTAPVPEEQPIPVKSEIRKEKGIAAGEKEIIKESIHVKQDANKDSAPKGREREERQWYEILYSVQIDRNDVTDKYGGLDLIGKVVYHFDNRWYTNPDRVRLNRSENFRLSVRVWGSTSVEVEIFLKGFDEPISRKRQMNLKETVVF